jgi:hypothetical protein
MIEREVSNRFTSGTVPDRGEKDEGRRDRAVRERNDVIRDRDRRTGLARKGEGAERNRL